MKSLKQVWAAAQRNPIAKRKHPGIGAEPKATITILIYFNRTLLLIPTGCALRWAQKDEGEIQIFPLHPSGLPYPLLKRLGGISALKNLRFIYNARVRLCRNCAFAP